MKCPKCGCRTLLLKQDEVTEYHDARRVTIFAHTPNGTSVLSQEHEGSYGVQSLTATCPKEDCDYNEDLIREYSSTNVLSYDVLEELLGNLARCPR